MAWVAWLGPEVDASEFSATLAAILDAAERPAVVGFSLASRTQASHVLTLAQALRDCAYAGHITAAGSFASAASAELLRDFPVLDSVVREPGEHVLPALLAAIEQGRAPADIPGLARRKVAAVPSSAPAVCVGHAVARLSAGARGPDAIAAEMHDLQRRDGADIFAFQDEDFFVPRRRDNLGRCHALADALERSGIDDFAIVVKARTHAVDRELFRVLRDRLHAIRVELNVVPERPTLFSRWPKHRTNLRALEIARELDVLCCLTVPAEPPLELLRGACDFPLLCDRVAAIRFEIEVCRHFHAARYERTWRAEAIALTRTLGEARLQVAEQGVPDSLLRVVDAQVERDAAELSGRIARALRRQPARRTPLAAAPQLRA